MTDKLLHEEAADSLVRQLDKARAERDRLEEKLAQATKDAVRLENEKLSALDANRALTAENAALRVAVGAFMYEYSVAHESNDPGEPYFLTTQERDAWRHLSDAVHEPLLLTQAVQRVVEANLTETKFGRLANMAPVPEADDVTEEEWADWRVAPTQYRKAQEERRAAVDHLRALLEGKGEG